MSDHQWSLPDLRDLYADVARIRDHDLGNRRMRELLGATLDTLVAADAEYAALSTPTTPDEGSLFAQIARDVAAFQALPATERDLLHRELATIGCNPGIVFSAPSTTADAESETADRVTQAGDAGARAVEKAYDDTRPIGSDFWHERSDDDRARLAAFALAFRPSEGEGLRAFAEAYVAAWEAGTGTVYLIDAARAALKGER